MFIASVCCLLFCFSSYPIVCCCICISCVVQASSVAFVTSRLEVVSLAGCRLAIMPSTGGDTPGTLVKRLLYAHIYICICIETYIMSYCHMLYAIYFTFIFEPFCYMLYMSHMYGFNI
jgi:hypothetical protein